MKIDVIENLESKYNTSYDNKNIVNEILKICYDEKNNRIAPKRTLSYIEKNNENLYKLIKENTDLLKVGEIIKYFIYNREIPKCKTCNDKNIILRAKLNENFDYCSNSCTIKSDEVQEKTHNTCIEKYGKRFNCINVDEYELGEHHLHKHLLNLEDTKDKVLMNFLQEMHWREVAEYFCLSQDIEGSVTKFMSRLGFPIVKEIKKGSSNLENEVYEYVCNLVGIDEVEKNTKKIIKPLELDIYIPNNKLAIEFNGLYWHSSNDVCDDNKYKKMHLNKTNLCEEQNITLLHIFENEWLNKNKRDIWKSVLSSKLNKNKKIYARQCKIVENIDYDIIKEFCENNHLQGHASFSKSKGLYYNDELVMVVTFSKPRYNNNYDNELIRLCTKKYINVVGGASKLLKNEIFISYANRRWSSGNIYNTLKLNKISISKPSYYYFKNEYKLYHRSSFMKHKLKEKLEFFDENISESENMYNNKYRRIWDCGNILYSNYKNKME